MIYAQTNIKRDRQTNFKLSDGNTFNNGTTGKERSFLKKNYENRSICSKIIDEQTLKYVYNFPFEVG